MRLRASFLVLVLMGLALVAFAPAAAVGTTEQFSGDLAGGCGPLHTYAVPAGTTTIDVVATADNPANDITVDLIDPTGKVVVHGDTLTSPETAHYQSDSLQAGDWSAKVCLFAGGGNPLPPTTYHGTFTTSDAPVLPGVPGAGTGKTTGTPTPTYTGGSLNFAPATVVDPQRTEGEPLTWTDKNGAIWESGPWGTTTQNSFVHRSTDGGLTYHIVSPVQLRPDAGPGGGDTDIVTDDQGYAYFVDLEALVNLGTSVSNDKGNTWRKNPTAVQNAAVDRQWFAVDNGSSPGPEDNTVFLAFHESSVGTFIYSSPGSTGSTDPVGGLVWSNSSANAPIPIASDATCAQLRFDPVKRNLYYACNEGTHVRVSVGHVDVGQRTNIAYKNVTVPDSPGKGSVGHLFPAIAVDGVGNVYVAWIDEKDNNVYYSMSTDGAKSWTSPVKVNGGESVTNEFLWAQASGTGNLVLGWIGTAKTSPTGPDGMPAWSSDPAGATHYPWYGYVATFTGANTFSPTIAQQRFTEKPMHFGQICNNGIGCSSGGDRTMADYFGFNYDANGLLHIVFDDTTTPLHGAHLYEVRQLADKAPSNPVDDATGDAQWPHYGPAAAGSTLADLDLTGVRLSPGPNGALRVQISAADLSSLAPPAGKSSAAWLVRFQAASTDAGGVTSYPIFYAGAQSTGGGPLSYFAGTATCTNSTPGTCKVVEYPATNAATGTLCGNTITIDVPTASGFGAALSGSTLYSVTGFAFGRNADAADLYADVDSTPSFDYSVGTGTPVSCTGTPGNGGGNGNGNGGGGNGGGGNTGGGNNGGGGGTGGGGATGGGTTGGGTTGGVLGTNKSRAVHSAKGRGVVHLAGRTRKGALAVSLQGTRGVLRFLDRSRNLRARSLGRLGVAYHGKSVRVVGIARLGKRKVPFVAVLVDRGRRDTFTLRLGTKYRYSGRFVRGNLSIS